MKAALLFFVVSAIFAFDSRFEYGCGQTSCTFKFIVPEVSVSSVVQYQSNILLKPSSALFLNKIVMHNPEALHNLLDLSDFRDFDSDFRSQCPVRGMFATTCRLLRPCRHYIFGKGYRREGTSSEQSLVTG
ncbi:unnamed protein product [Haemonchus placei]|uniref:Uncharacterized protein n=1 Tax=Haemonchus placei TaxID=6290 RepID=A0A0N4VXS7_HAEPC|nr:unnamed protein product [Haemonchus placei]